MAKTISWNILINPIVQVVMIGLVSLFLYLLSASALKESLIIDPAPMLQVDERAGHKVKIKTGLFINNFLKVDLIKNQFELMGTVWFEFNQKEASLEVLEEAVFSKADVKPQANLHDNLCGSATPVITTKGDMVLAQYPVKIDFTSNLNHKLYPFDSHRLYLTLNNMHLDSDKFAFSLEQDGLVVSPNTIAHGWQIIDQYGHTGFVTKQIAHNQVMSYPRVVYAIDFKRESFKDILLLLLPLLVLFFMSMFSFSYDHKIDRENILEIGVASVAAMVAYRFVIDTVAPNTPYFMLIDWLFSLFLILSFIVFLVNVFELFKKHRGLVVLCLHLSLLVSWYGLLFIWG